MATTLSFPPPSASSHAGPSTIPQTSTNTNRPHIQLTPEIVARLRPAKLFKEREVLNPDIQSNPPWRSTASFPNYSQKPLIESICFDDGGEQCVTAGEDEMFVLWDVVKGVKKKQFYSRKYGISHVRFTHGRSNILHASSRPGEHDIRYHSTHDNKYLMYFRGHTGRVRSLQMHPLDDSFLSAGDDGTVRMYDLRNPSPKALLNDIGASCIAAYDNSGSVFAVASSDHQTIALFATASPDGQPFHHAPIHDPLLALQSQPPRYPIFTSISFSSSGDFILIGTSSDIHYVLDAYTLKLHCRLEGHKGLELDYRLARDVQPRRGGSGEEVCWTADSNWVISGSADGMVYGWDISVHPRDENADADANEQLDNSRAGAAAAAAAAQTPTLQPVVKLKNGESASTAPSRAVRFSPRYGVLAVGGDELSFWLPAKDETGDE